MEYLPRYEFQKCVGRYQGDARLRGFSCWDQYLAMGFAQLTCRESLSEIREDTPVMSFVGVGQIAPGDLPAKSYVIEFATDRT